MLRSTKMLHFLAIITVGVLGGLVLIAGPAEIQVPSGPLAAAAPDAVGLTCPGDVGLDAAPLADVRTQVGQPCCETLCEQVCGVGEACLCKKCQVLGCGL